MGFSSRMRFLPHGRKVVGLCTLEGIFITRDNLKVITIAPKYARSQIMVTHNYGYPYGYPGHGHQQVILLPL